LENKLFKSDDSYFHVNRDVKRQLTILGPQTPSESSRIAASFTESGIGGVSSFKVTGIYCFESEYDASVIER
jgi:hypothetical protein